MNIAEIKKLDIANGTGIRTSVFVSGCRHNCPGCFNSIAQNFNYGSPFNENILTEIVDSIKNPIIQGISFLGGEPLDELNVAGVLEIVKAVKKEAPDKDIWLWTGYLLEDLLKRSEKDKNLLSILKSINILVDGQFIENQKELSLKFRGSKNQRVIDMVSTLKNNSIILYDV